MPAVTLIHGGGGNCHSFMRQMPCLAKSGFFVIAISIRGWGASSLDREDAQLYSHEYLAPDVLAVLDACGVDRTALLGHSVGGFSVARMAIEAPQRLTHAIFSSTFYGLVDDAASPASTPYVTQYVQNRQSDQTACERLALEVKAQLAEGSAGASHPSFGPEHGRFEAPNRPGSFSAAFREMQPELVWFYEAQNDSNAQSAG
jgi:Predicted hydrolases or acyltransferases (alpha/beta hydrolase superfamily)